MIDINEAQIWILTNIANSKVPEMTDFKYLLEESSKEEQTFELALAYYILELENASLIKGGKGVFATGRKIHHMYENNVRIIWFDRLLITPKGVLYAYIMECRASLFPYI
ncbi:hypothetical protein ABE142_24240 [Paenibacillus alvei]|uniref:hypothetical protein n=1 Tax=Paenibacillus alvei TaxID=44250 RepID=UPI003D2CE25E